MSKNHCSQHLLPAMKKLLLLLLSSIFCYPLAAQQEEWESVFSQLINEEEGENWETSYDVLSDLEQHPINLNTATREDFECIPFLTDQQIEELCAYLYQYGGMRSFGELAMIESLDPVRQQLLPFSLISTTNKRTRHSLHGKTLPNMENTTLS